MAKKKKEPEDTGKAGEKLTRQWRKRFTRGSKYQKDNSNSWEKNARLLYGCTGQNPTDYDIAIGWGLAQFLISKIYYSNPTALVRPRSKDSRNIARFLSDVCEYDAEDMDLRDVGNLCLADNFTSGYGALIEDYCNEISEYDDEDEDKKGMEITDQYYMFRRIPPLDILFDPDGIKLDLSDHKWVMVAYYPTLEKLHSDKERYKWLPDDIDESKAATPRKPQKDSEPIGGAADSGDKDPAYKQIRVYEVWDKVARKIYDFAADKKKVIGERDWPFKLCRSGKYLFPVTLLGLLQQEGFYPKPFLDLIQPQLVALTKINRMFINDATTKWRKFATIEGLVDMDKAAKILDTASDGTGVIEVAKDALDDVLAPGVHQHPDLHNLIVPLQDVKVNQDYIVAFETIMGQIQQILGFADAARGGLPKTRSSREAVAIKEAQDRRTNKMADPICVFHRQVMEKHIMILQQTAEVERYVKLVDELGRFKEFQQYTKDSIEGKFFFEVLPGSSRPKDIESARQEKINFAQMFIPMLQKEGYSIAPIVYDLAEFFQIKNVDDFFRNQKAAAAMVAKVLFAVKNGVNGVKPQDLPNAASQLVMSVLTADEMKSIGAEMGSAAPGSAGGGEVVPMGQRGESDTSKAS